MTSVLKSPVTVKNMSIELTDLVPCINLRTKWSNPFIAIIKRMNCIYFRYFLFSERKTIRSVCCICITTLSPPSRLGSVSSSWQVMYNLKLIAHRKRVAPRHAEPPFEKFLCRSHTRDAVSSPPTATSVLAVPPY